MYVIYHHCTCSLQRPASSPSEEDFTSNAVTIMAWIGFSLVKAEDNENRVVDKVMLATK
jgi:hypothetical protein